MNLAIEFKVWMRAGERDIFSDFNAFYENKVTLCLVFSRYLTLILAATNQESRYIGEEEHDHTISFMTYYDVIVL